MSEKRAVGDALETATERWLVAQGLRPLARQVRYRLGELDLVMLHGEVLVFVEVRYRAHAGHGDGIDSITRAKRAKLVRAASLFLQGHPRYANTPCRFDVVAATGALDAPQFEWIRDAFRVDG
ncbi:MAG: YraN family protein [Xanthomonadales bacterium]|nr:YraN family protein [Xanthomonadales bacterium]MBK7144198.1 YraN family protein [Xanthomonadales bacterium]MCC6562597.1 YraN family protein [Xanthomonadales bacterium]